MSQQHTTQASGQGMLERVFKLREHGTTVWTEVIAGLTTPLAMIYVVFVNPQILGVAGMDTSAVFITTCLITTSDSTMMGLFTNLPIAPAPAVDLNAFFVFVIVQAMGLPRQVGMGATFWGAIGLLLLTIFRVCYQMIASISVNLRMGITNGISLFIGVMGLKNVGVTVANPETLVGIGNLTSHGVPLRILGFSIITTLASHDIHMTVLVLIVVTTLLGWVLDDVHYDGIVSTSPSVTAVMGHVGLAGSFNLGLAGVILSFMLVNLLDSFGAPIGVTDKVGLADEKGRFPHVEQALYVDSTSSVTDSFIEAFSVTAYIESSFGVSVGDRTGLAVMIVGLLFLLVIFLLPLAGMVPSYAAVGTLIYVGVLTASSLTRVNQQDLTESVPMLITAMMMPFNFSTTKGIALGFTPYCMMKTGTGHLYDLSSYVIVVVLPFIPKIISIDAH